VKPATAFVRVTGKIIIGTDGEPRWNATTTTPVDYQSNSLTGHSETDLQGFFHTFDQISFTVDRSNPLQIVLPRGYPPAPSFLGVTDATMSAVINSIFPLASAPAGVQVSVLFGDGSRATYILQGPLDPNGNRIWTWSGWAWDPAGHLILRDGSHPGNINTSGTGGGSYQGNGFGTGSNWNFIVSGASSCVSTTTITVNGELSSYIFIAPC
jgi:hypothetical protein